MGSATSAKKRQIQQLLDLIGEWGNSVPDTQDTQDSADIGQMVQELSKKLQSWKAAPPSKQTMLGALKDMVLKMDGKEVAKAKGKSGSASSLHQQSFYDALRQRQNEIKEGKGSSKPKPKGKGKGSSELPKFDFKRAFPDKVLISWQTMESSLEKGSCPVGDIVLCRDASQMLLFQEMVQLAGLSTKIIMIASALSGDPAVTGGTKCLVPVLGNLALKEAWISRLDGQQAEKYGVAPQKATPSTSLVEKEMVTLRVNVALDFVRQPVKNNLISDPTLALSIAGVKQYLTEAKTFRWTTSVNRMMSGYVTFDAGQLQSVLQRSGNGAVFFQRLASNQLAPPEVEWLPWDKSESHQDYLTRALSLAEKAGSFLAFRRGGGACIGVITPKLLHKDRHWSLYGVGPRAEPATVSSLLKDLGWEVKFRPNEPHRADQPWHFYGKLAEESQEREFSYDIPGSQGNQYLRIVMRHRHRKPEEDETISLRHRWWDSEAPSASEVPTTEMDVSPTLADTQEEDGKAGSTISPAKKKARSLGANGSQGASKEMPERGPGNFKILDLGGTGDCGYRCVAYGIAFWNHKEFKGKMDEEAQFRSKIVEIGAVLRG